MVSHPETGSDSPIGSDRDRGRDSTGTQLSLPVLTYDFSRDGSSGHFHLKSSNQN